MKRYVAAAVIAWTTASCNEAIPVVPSGEQSTPKVIAAGDPPVARLRVTVDGRPDIRAIPSVSVIAFDARDSTGTDLHYRIDLGDGKVTEEPAGEHVYAQGDRLYRPRLMITDSAGRTATAEAIVGVGRIDWTWLNVSPSGTRWIVFSRVGRSLFGRYDFDNASHSLTGSLLDDRGIRLIVDDGSESFQGRWNDNPFELYLTAHTGPDAGRTLRFRALGANH